MSAKYHRFLEKIPDYLAGRMDPKDQAEFEAFAHACPRFQKEIDDLRPAFKWLDREFEAAGNTEFRLSHARRADLWRASRSNVVAFPGGDFSGGQDRRIGAGRIRRQLRKWVAVAAVLAVGAFFSFSAVRDVSQEQIVPDQIAAVSPVVQIAAQPAGHVYVYPPAYGLDRPEAWRLANRRAGPNVVPASAIDQGIQFSEWRPASPAVYGLDGPRPYYEFSTAAGMGAI